MAPFLQTVDEGSVRYVTLDRPGRLNAIPTDAWPEMETAFVDFESSAQRVLVLRGAGGNFSAGADLGDDVKGLQSPADTAAIMRRVGRAAEALYAISKPTIAAVQGVAVGAGMNLALGCDIVLASTDARFSEVFVRRGLTVDFGGTWLLPRLVGLAKAKELALTGRLVGAAEAGEIGLVARVAENLDEALDETLAAVLAGAPLGQRFAKRGLNMSGETSFAEAIAYEGQAQALCLVTEDVVEGVTAFLQKRSPMFRGR